MKRISLPLAAAFLTITLGATVAGYYLGATKALAPQAQGTPSPSVAPAAPAPDPAKAGRRILYWYDPMVPGQKFDKPGRSPYMDMDLVPKYADDAGQAGVQIDPRVAQNLGMQVVAVERRRLASGVTAVASVRLDERHVAIVQARSAGFVERVVPRAPGDVIAAGAPIAEVLVSDWAGAQAEYLAVRASGDAALTAAARARLLLLGMSAAQIEAVERSGAPRATLTVAAPIAGVIQELGVRPGMTVTAGMTLARINGLASVWLEAAVPEAHAGLLAAGREVTARFAAYPGEQFRGRIESVLPEANAETRTLRVRMTFPNREQRLKAGMFAQVDIAGTAEEELAVPASAVVRTGVRDLVFVADQPGRFRPVVVRVGAEREGYLPVLAGLSEGEKVAVSGQFLIDSEASLQGLTARLGSDGTGARDDAHAGHAQAGGSNASGQRGSAANATGAQPPVHAHRAGQAPLHEARGTVDEIDGSTITLSHGAVPALKWGPMTMPFQLADAKLATGLKRGDGVRFRFREVDDGYVIEHIEKSREAR